MSGPVPRRTRYSLAAVKGKVVPTLVPALPVNPTPLDSGNESACNGGALVEESERLEGNLERGKDYCSTPVV